MRNVFLRMLVIALGVAALNSCKKDENGGGSVAAVTSLGCNTASFSAIATKQMPYNAIATIPYSGGNGVSFVKGNAIPSSGVSGLTATLDQGTLTSGTGNISFTIAGTPSDSGIATFAIEFGGQNCDLQLAVTGGGGLQVPAPFNKIYGASNISFDGTWVIVKTLALPEHKSVYWPVNNPLYEAFSGPTFNNSNFVKNPNRIIAQNFSIKIPAVPNVSNTHPATPLGVIGVAIDGVPFFNQYAGPNAPLTNEIGSFDQWWAHPQQTGVYHYHVEPKYLTTVKATPSSLMGFLLDGYPVYGPQEDDGSSPSNLDVYHGHSHATTEYPGGTYHYHFTQAAPYLNGNGFYGDPGTVTQ